MRTAGSTPGGNLAILTCPAATLAVVIAAVGWSRSARCAGAQSSKPKADDVGITATEIHVAVIADVDNSLAPGVFKASVDAMNAWAKVVNKDGGLAGRKVVIDFIDSKLNPNETRNATIKACANDFAMVGGEALFMNNVDDMVACQNKAGRRSASPTCRASPSTRAVVLAGHLPDHRPRAVLHHQERPPADVPRAAG